MRNSLTGVLVVAVLAAFLAAPSGAGELSGVTLPDSIEIEGQKLILNGMALRKVAIVKVYVAGLYVPERVTTGEAVLDADAPRRVVMSWLRSGGKERICDGWYEGLEANTPNAPAEVHAQFDELCSWMPDAEKGDKFVFHYKPGMGTGVVINGERKGAIEGKAFADALWRVWIGDNPGPGQKFKKDLLGG